MDSYDNSDGPPFLSRLQYVSNIKFCADNYCLQRMNPDDCGDVLTFLLAPQVDIFSFEKCWVGCHEIWYKNICQTFVITFLNFSSNALVKSF